tara:strand:- start:676 stop:972 length:297 start_codon:yes stop_codon:yes gene_type:complete
MRRIKTSMVGNMMLAKNPVVKQGVTDGDEFLTNNGEMYSPGNNLYDRHNGEYHIHKSGHVCAGTHDSMVMQNQRFLFELPKNPITREKLLKSLESLRG